MVVLMRARAGVCLVVMAVLGTTARGGQADAIRARSAPAPQAVDVTAERFSFSPSRIRTTVGTTLTIRVESDDTAHGFHIVGTNVDVVVPKRGRGAVTVTFTPDHDGRYTFECSQLCGAGHSFMRGTIEVAKAGPQ
jgi:cytochrome c oxidase subunit 2